MFYYLGFYDDLKKQTEPRYFSPAARNKMEYIIQKLDSLERDVKVVSASVTTGLSKAPEKEIQIGAHTKLKLFFSLGRRNIFTKAIDLVLAKLRVFFYVLSHINKNDVVLVYHSKEYMKSLAIAKKFKNFRMILEMEEIYADVLENKHQKPREMQFASLADSFIFPTQLLNDVVNSADKPFAVIHGTYQAEPDRGHRFDDGNIHVVYAGTLDPRKGGAVAAAAAEFLPENYHVHVLGFGSEQQINDMKQLTQEISQKGKATATYDGLLSGEDYIRFIQACDIGLSTQNPDAAFNATSFPSKVLSYMANGLRVVSVRIKAVETSAVGDMITYYDEQTPESIAKAIMSVDMSQPYDSRMRIAELDEQFQRELKKLIEAK